MKPLALRIPRLRATGVAGSIALAALAASPHAHAELDGTMPDQAVMKARSASSSTGSNTAGNARNAQRTQLNGALRRRTVTDAGGTTINEYATSTGRIVGYTWAGPTMPDLRALLGKYSVSYKAGAAAATADGNLHISRIARPDVIVESGGPMRGYVGRAWLPTALPPGVTADDFQ